MLTKSAQTRTYRSGQWIVVECREGLDPGAASVLRSVIETRDSGWVGAILNLGASSKIDSNGRRILTNFHQALRQQGRTLGLVVEDVDLRNQLAEGEDQITLLADLSELKRSIHEMSTERRKALEQGGMRQTNLLAFQLRCPLCRCELVKGWMPSLKLHKLEWSANEITPQMVRVDGVQELLDVETYRPAVCPECLFAAVRLDWFDNPILNLRTTLQDSSLDRLVKNSQRRRMLLSGEKMEEDVSLPTFFGMPRLRQAASFAWALAADAMQVIGKERSSVDAMGVAMSHIMRARFAKEGESLEKHYTGAYIWLRTALETPDNYAEERMAEASVYLVSVCLAMGREAEAKEVRHKAALQWGERRDFSFWLDRSESLLG
ncbi:MAG: hypothetical protein RL318_1419 [Fibrobacterota bacterium]|jgi:hypothetical protein